MKNVFLIKAFSLMLLCSSANSFCMEESGGGQGGSNRDRKSASIPTPKSERDTQKALILLGASAGLAAGAHFLGDRAEFQTAGNFFNLTRGELQAACALSSACAGIALIAEKEWKPTFRSAAWRFPLMAMVGGLLNHPYANKALSFMPLGLGAWFKDNPPFGKPGISAIYNIGAWYALKPSLDRVENRVSDWFTSKDATKNASK